MVEPAQLSLYIGAIDASEVQVQVVPAQAFTAFEGHWTEGISESTTVMTKLQSAVLPQASVALNVIVLAPNGNVVPEAGPETKLTLTGLLQSVAIGVL